MASGGQWLGIGLAPPFQCIPGSGVSKGRWGRKGTQPSATVQRLSPSTCSGFPRGHGPGIVPRHKRRCTAPRQPRAAPEGPSPRNDPKGPSPQSAGAALGSARDPRTSARQKQRNPTEIGKWHPFSNHRRKARHQILRRRHQIPPPPQKKTAPNPREVTHCPGGPYARGPKPARPPATPSSRAAAC